MLKFVTCDLLIKGITIEIETEDTEVPQDVLSNIVKLVLENEGLQNEDVYGIDSNNFLEDLRLANAMHWAEKNHKCYLSTPHTVTGGISVYNIPMLLKRYEIEKGKRIKYD